MLNNNRFLEKITSRTKIYLAIIALLLIIICINKPVFIVPGIILFILIIIYSYWTNSKRNAELSRQIQNLTMTMDGTAKKSLINSPFPLIIIETTGNIIWKSSKFVYEFANIDINNYLIDILEEIKEDIEAQQDKKQKTITKKVQIGNKIYSVLGEYIRSKQNDKSEYITILYFLDITQIMKEKKKYEDSRTCVGILTVDNYEEIIQRIDVENRPQVIAEIEKVIYDWAASTGGIVVKNDRNTFVYVFEYKYLKEIKENKFDILDQIKEINVEAGIQLTLSIAISIDGDTNYDKYKTALESMDIVLGRGGDQAVIKTKDKFAFYGGKSKAVEKTTKVKSRLIGHALREVILESDHVFIMGHKYPDMDAMGAAVGIYDICKSCNKTANIVLDHSNESIEEFIKRIKRSDYHDGIFVDCDYAIRECMKNTLVVVVDTHRPNFTECPQLLEISDKVVVIDHHRRGVDFINDTVLLFHEIYVSSTCEMVTELVQYIEDDVRINKLTAEGLLAGISLDTKNFAFKTGVRTFEAASYLKKSGADTIEVKKLFNSDIKDFITKAEIIQNAKVINNNICLAYTKTETDNINIVIAQAADELLNIKEVEASFVLARKDDRVFISARSLGNINVHVLMENLGGGGHRDMAGAQLDTSLEKAYEMVKDTIQTCIKEEE